MNFKQLETLNKCLIDWNVNYSIYPYNGYTINEVLCQFFDAINKGIVTINEYTNLVNALMEWIKNEGLKEEVEKALDALVKDGTLENMINERILTDIKDRVTKLEKKCGQYYYNKNILAYGCVGDGLTNNKENLSRAFMELKENDTLFIPNGEYLINLTDDDLKDEPEMNRKKIYFWQILDNLNNVTIRGDGVIKIKTNFINKKGGLFCIKNSNNFKIDGVTFVGDVEYNQNQILRDISLNGFSFVRCNGLKIINTTMTNILAILEITGSLTTPNDGYNVGENTVISNNLFKNYGQVTSFGGGVNGLIFTNNVCVNPLQAGIKISSNINEISNIEKSANIIISDNIIKWEKNFNFPIVEWQPTKTYCPVGVMVESHTNNIKISNNIIDYSQLLMTIDNPITDYTPIFILGKSIQTVNLNKSITLEHNTLKTNGKGYGIIVSPFVKSIIIDGNTLDNGISYRTFSEVVNKNDMFKFVNNNIIGEFYLYIKNANISDLIVENNKISNTSTEREIMSIEENNVKNFILRNNDFQNNIIRTSTTINAENIIIDGNIIGQINISVSECNIFQITKNTFLHNGSVCLVKNHENNDLYFSYNVCKSGGSALKLDKGNVYLISNSLINNTGLPYDFTESVKIKGGSYTGNGRPTNNANTGVTYRDLSNIKNNFYLKISDETDGWYCFVKE